MCGIIALFTRHSEGLEARAQAALTLVQDRGPDARHLVFSGLTPEQRYCSALGAARLAMVDIHGPDQPLATAEGRYRIVFNGEIFNYRALRAQLMAEGVRFQTAGDTEVVLHAVVREGVQAPDRFRGQFAYVVEDTVDGIVHAGRDPHGICPLYYGRNAAGEFILGSSLTVLLANHVAPADLRVLPQGHTLSYDIARQHLSFHRYYDLAARLVPSPGPIDPTELREQLFAVIRQRIPDEVPYATIVGGIDSSLVTAVCSRSPNPPACIITVTTTEGLESSDVRNARLLAGQLGIASRIGVVDAAYVRDNLARVVSVMGSANYLAVMSGIVGLKAAEMAREAGVKAIVTGGGADEIFGGYDFVWNLFEPRLVAQNLLHVFRQSGTFECHREDSVIAAVGIEARPAYYDRELAERIFALPVDQRIRGLGTTDITEKVLLRQAAQGVLPEVIVATRKSPFYRSTSILPLVERVAEELMSADEAAAWKGQMAQDCPSWLRFQLVPGRGTLLVHKTFSQCFPGLAELGVPLAPPDYDDPASCGRYHGAFGSPLLEGYRWYRRPPVVI
jgi:asparagine synthase (glutamine-hydrolysing)